ncbi:hypothetical protein ACFFX1_46995 [Dactylosporangium sucinum]|uniref:Uncharacterized protein n=1 Tax=Dactylosporangium sucinum TaxID=1424081 RepID=A0A917UBK7_9ACTN|nr:hypothetical protein [Dactylosporangium sucinum]GGM76048.1 hypothetical protein GCM10007977_091900 [Dactylosporangium sucinum]
MGADRRASGADSAGPADAARPAGERGEASAARRARQASAADVARWDGDRHGQPTRTRSQPATAAAEAVADPRGRPNASHGAAGEVAEPG